MEIKIAELKISQPAVSALLNEGIETVGDLLEYSRTDLLKLHGFGPKGLKILEGILLDLGLELKQP